MAEMHAITVPFRRPEVLAYGVWSEDSKWYLYGDQKYWHQDIIALADMRRKGVQGGTLVGEALERFVKTCLDTQDFRVLGIGFEPSDIAYLKQLQACRQLS